MKAQVGRDPIGVWHLRLFKELVMRSAHWMAAATLALGSVSPAWALEGDGLILHSQRAEWPRLQGRLSLSTSTPLWRADAMNADTSNLQVSGLSVMGDYYFTRALGNARDAGGFRATSGLLVGARSTSLLSTLPTAGLTGRAFSFGRSIGGLGLVGTDVAAQSDPATVPYFGVGYTGLSGRGGWGFSADIGLMALSPGSAVKLGRVLSGNQSLDDVLREMRLSPLVQVGVSYSF